MLEEQQLLNDDQATYQNLHAAAIVPKGLRSRCLRCLAPPLVVAVIFLGASSPKSHSAAAWLRGASQRDFSTQGSARDGDGFCKASTSFDVCTLQHTEANVDMVKVSLFGNSYSGYYCWTDHGVKEVFESGRADEWTIGGLLPQELDVRVSMHTLFNSGLYHHVDSFEHILTAEDPDFVALQDGSLIAMGWKGGVQKDGTIDASTPQARHTAQAMQETYGPAVWNWAANHVRKNGQKPVVFLVAAWARPEEAFVEAQSGGEAELEGIVQGGWAQKNYEVYREGVTPSLKSKHYMNAHHEGEMLRSTLEGLGLYRERLFKGAAAAAGAVDGAEFRRDCPFEVALAPIGVAFHDIRTRVEDVFQQSQRPDVWLDGYDTSAYVNFPYGAVHRSPNQAERRTWPGAGEKDLFFTQVQDDMPWFGHPTPAGTYLYGAMLKKTVLSAMQGKDGRTFGDVQLQYDSSSEHQIKNLIIEEVNAFSLQQLNDDWRQTGRKVCSAASHLCPGGGVAEEVQYPTPAPEPVLEPEPPPEPEIYTPSVEPEPVADTSEWGPWADLEASQGTAADTGQAWMESASPPELPCAEVFEDCRYTSACCDSSMSCYQKNEEWANCMVSCKAGIHWDEAEEWRTPWTCERL